MTDPHQIEALFEALTSDVRRASYERIDRFSAEIETILESLPTLDRAALTRVRAKAERCCACLNAAAQGLRAGQRRLAEMAAAERSQIYDRTGARQALPVEGGGRRL